MNLNITLRSSLLFWLFLLLETAYAQSIPVVGRVIDGSTPLSNSNVSVFTSADGFDHRVDKGVSGSDGKFKVYSSTTDVERVDNIIPDNYKLSNPFPNPSSGVVNVHFSVPKPVDVGLKVYNVLGEELFSSNYDVSSGTWATGFDLSDYASGIYVVGLFSGGKLVGSNKFVIDKNVIGYDGPLSLTKVSGYDPVPLNKLEAVRYIDSVVVSHPDYRSSVLRNVGFLQGDSVDVGDVSMFTGLVNANVFVYDLKFWREKELHPLVNAVVKIGSDSVFTDAQGRGLFIVPATSVPYPVMITHPDMFTRETKVVVDNEKNLEFDVLTHSSYPDSIYNFIQTNFGVIYPDPNISHLNARWLNQPEFIFKTDTSLASPNPQIESWMQLINFNLMKLDSIMIPVSANPINPEGFLKDYTWKIDKDAWYYDPDSDLHNNGKFIIFWDDSVRLNYGGLAFTGAYLNYATGEIYAAETEYDSFKFYPDDPVVWRNIDRGVIHELDTGIYNTGRRTDIQSVSNSGPSYEFRNYTENDKLIRPYLLSRPPGTVAPDKDNGWCQYNPESIRKPSNLMASYTFTMEDGRTLSYQEKVDDLSKFKSMKELPIDKVKEMIEKAVEIKDNQK